MLLIADRVKIHTMFGSNDPKQSILEIITGVEYLFRYGNLVNQNQRLNCSIKIPVMSNHKQYIHMLFKPIISPFKQIGSYTSRSTLENGKARLTPVKTADKILELTSSSC